MRGGESRVRWRVGVNAKVGAKARSTQATIELDPIEPARGEGTTKRHWTRGDKRGLSPKLHPTCWLATFFV